MGLHELSPGDDPSVVAHNGTRVPLRLTLSETLKFVSAEALVQASSMRPGLAADKVRARARVQEVALLSETASAARRQVLWVITVPAIWSEAAKALMREVAVQAGCVVGCALLKPE